MYPSGQARVPPITFEICNDAYFSLFSTVPRWPDPPREYPWRIRPYLAESDELRGERKTRAKTEHARCIRATDRARTVSTEARSKRTLIDNGNSHHPGIDVHTSARARIRLGADTSHAPNHKRVVCRFTKAKFGPMQKSELPTDQCSIVSARVELAVPQVEIEVYPFHFLPKSAKRAEIHENSRFLRSQRAA